MNPLDSKDWSVDDAFGPAHELGTMLQQAMEDERSWRDMLPEVYARTTHHGLVPAMLPVAETLAERLHDLPDLASALLLLHDFAQQCEEGTLWWRQRGSSAVAAGLAETIAPYMPALEGLLASEDSVVRAGVALVLSHRFGTGASTQNKLLTAVEAEPDSVVAASMLVALGHLGEPIDEAKLRGWLDDGDDWRRAAAGIAAITIARGRADGAVLDAVQLAGHLPRVCERMCEWADASPRFGWCHGFIAGLAIDALRACAEHDQSGAWSRLLAILDARITDPSLDEPPSVTLGTAASMAARALLDLAFPDNQVRQMPRLAAELSGAQRALLERTQQHRLEVDLRSVWVPARHDDLGRWLFPARGGPLDLTIELNRDGERVRWPIWRLLHGVERQEVDLDEAISLVRKRLQPSELMALGRDILGETLAQRPYASFISITLIRGPLMSRLVDGLQLELAPAARGFAEDLSILPMVPPDHAAFALHAISSSDEWDDKLIRAALGVSSDSARALLLRLPLGRRETILVDTLPTVGWDSSLVLLSDTCPTATMAEFLVDAVAQGAWIPDEWLVTLLTAIGAPAKGAIERHIATRPGDKRSMLTKVLEVLAPQGR